MKKLLGILVLGFLLSGNAYAGDTHYLRCSTKKIGETSGDTWFFIINYKYNFVAETTDALNLSHEIISNKDKTLIAKIDYSKLEFNKEIGLVTKYKLKDGIWEKIDSAGCQNIVEKF